MKVEIITHRIYNYVIFYDGSMACRCVIAGIQTKKLLFIRHLSVQGKKKIAEFEYEACLDYLKTEREKRRNFIQTAYDECENERIKQLIREKAE